MLRKTLVRPRHERSVIPTGQNFNAQRWPRLMDKGVQELFYIVKTKKDFYLWPMDILKRILHRDLVNKGRISFQFISGNNRNNSYSTQCQPLDRYPLPPLIAFRINRWFLISWVTKRFCFLKEIFHSNLSRFEISAVSSDSCAYIYFKNA